MSWDKVQVQKRFYDRARILERELDAIKSKVRKIDNLKKIDNYKKIHDELLGELFICWNLECDASLASKEMLIEHLSELLDIELDMPTEAYSYKNFVNGVTKNIKRIIDTL